ncbi:hypothetical protein A8926_4561 [Saccharopolyspora spinosa]|uniref:Uncharacterized protein n=1 Tax=Saccharopolyspora spinosa TaxID=60894 RepID=A0A2N3Y192_SACSN|nr:hypothetical protein A8926_4561 [Saccharopolyspora spinosa]
MVCSSCGRDNQVGDVTWHAVIGLGIGDDDPHERPFRNNHAMIDNHNQSVTAERAPAH